jgi:Domain of unknown function (DUF397)
MRSVNKQDAERFSADSTDTAWRTSSRCSHGDCVQVGSLPARAVGVRDTKNRGGGPDLVFTPAAWRSFITEVKQGGRAR